MSRKEDFGISFNVRSRSFLLDAVAGFFDNGGTRCYVVAADSGSDPVQGLVDAVAALAPLEDMDLVAVPDATFGERVCVFVELRTGHGELTVETLNAHLAARGTGKELWPERLEVLTALPRSSGGKVAKGDLAAIARGL